MTPTLEESVDGLGKRWKTPTERALKVAMKNEEIRIVALRVAKKTLERIADPPEKTNGGVAINSVLKAAEAVQQIESILKGLL